MRAKDVWVSGMCITGRQEAYAGTYGGITGDFMGKGKSLLKEKRQLFFCCSFALAAGCLRFPEYKPFYQLYPVHFGFHAGARTRVSTVRTSYPVQAHKISIHEKTISSYDVMAKA